MYNSDIDDRTRLCLVTSDQMKIEKLEVELAFERHRSALLTRELLALTDRHSAVLSQIVLTIGGNCACDGE